MIFTKDRNYFKSLRANKRDRIRRSRDPGFKDHTKLKNIGSREIFLNQSIFQFPRENKPLRSP